MEAREYTEGSLPLLERERELAALRRIVERAGRGRGGLAIVGGPAGIGKTRLLEAAIDATTELTAATARGRELEGDVAYGVARQLVEPLVDELTAAERQQFLGGEAALASRALGDRPSEVASDPAPVRDALSRLVLRLARKQPLLMAVDDLQWCDESSGLWLLDLAGRVRDAPIALIVTLRDDGCRERWLEQLSSDSDALRVAPRALTAPAVAAVARMALGDDHGEASAAECHALTGGNPFLVAELLAAARDEVVRNPRAALDLRALAPRDVVDSVQRRVARLPAPARAVAQALAVLERAATIDETAHVAGVGLERAAQGLDVLAAARLASASPPFEFLLPLVRRVVYDALPPSARGRAHERAAQVLADRGILEQAATHLLHSGVAPDPRGVEILTVAAAAASARGAPSVAARLLARALSGRDVDGPRRARIIGELGLAELRMLDPRGFDHVREAIAADPSDAPRYAAPASRALTVLWRHREAVELLMPVVDCAADALSRRELEGELLAAASADVVTLPLARERLARVLDRTRSSPSTDPVAWGVRAMATAAAGRERERSVRIAHEAIEGGRLAAATASGLPYPSMALIWSDEVDVAEAAWQVALARAGSAGSQLEAALARCYLAICANARGDRAAAEPLARAALDAVLEARVPAGPNPIAPLAEAMVARGAASVAVALVEEHLDEITRTSVSYPIALFNRGRARMAAGDTGGLADVLAAGRRMVAEGAGNPAVAPWRSVAGTWLVAHGDVERGSQLVSEELALATGFGAPSAIGIALTAASSIADGADSVATAERAVRTLERSPARGALAEAHACHGRALACAGAHVEAREPLRLALDLAHHLGALALAERTRAELVAAGARPRRPALTGPAALTPSEERVARLAATGRSSSAIADELVVSVRTVDMHLSRTYRKLGIDGREELRAALDA